MQKPLTPRERIKLWAAGMNLFETGLEVAEKASNPALLRALRKLELDCRHAGVDTQWRDLSACTPILREHGVLQDGRDFLRRRTVVLTDYAKDALLGRAVPRKAGVSVHTVQ